MARHDWTSIDWDSEFTFLPDHLHVEACGALKTGDEVTIRFVVDRVTPYSDCEYFAAKLSPAKPRSAWGWWRRINRVFGKRDI